MKLEQSFTVTAPVEQVWAALVDVERVAPCLPGAQVTGQAPDGSYEGTFSVKLGPATAAYRGHLKMDSLDEATRTATMHANGTDKRGQGGAHAVIVSTMRQEGGETHVDVSTDFTITGRLARFGRGGMIEDISKRLMRDFAQCLESTLGAAPAAAEPPPAAAEPAPAAASGGEEPASAAASAAEEAAPAATSVGEEPAPAAASGAEEAAPAAASGREEPAPAAASGGEESVAAAASGEAASAPLPGEDAAEAEPAAPAAPLGGEESPAAEEAAPSAALPGEEAEPARRAGEADPWGPLSPPAEPAAPVEEEAPAQRTHSIPPPSARPAAAPAKPVKGLSLLFGVLWDRIKAFFGRLFGRGKKD
jgi:carbon monoxide dehydrogenase subunit G